MQPYAKPSHDIAGREACHVESMGHPVAFSEENMEKLRHLQLTEKEIFDDHLSLEIHIDIDEKAKTFTSFCSASISGSPLCRSARLTSS